MIRALKIHVTKLIGLITSLVNDFHSYRYLINWANSLRSAHNPIIDEMPWISYKAKNWLDSYLTPDMILFEYGSGGSTLYFSNKVGKLISVEHDPIWYHQVLHAINVKGVKNCNYILVKPEDIESTDNESKNLYKSKSILNYKNSSFEDYVKVIERYDDEKFDLVIVDGRAREGCIRHALNSVKPNGYLLLDNSERSVYSKIVFELSKYKRIDFYGLTPYTWFPSQTSVWKIDKHNKSLQ